MKSITVLLLCFLAACSPDRPAESTYETVGTQAERVAEVSKLISKSTRLPSPLLDAHFIQQKIGDGRLGPSDYSTFYALRIAPADLAAWRSALEPIEAQNKPILFASPREPRAWWLTQDEFHDLTFYSPVRLTGRLHGWVGVAPDGRIFAYGFTT
jgi:hypothetical protein